MVLLHTVAADLKWGGLYECDRGILSAALITVKLVFLFLFLFSTICTARRIVIAAHTQDSFSLSIFSCGESPRRYRACPRLSYGKRPAPSTTVLVEGWRE